MTIEEIIKKKKDIPYFWLDDKPNLDLSYLFSDIKTTPVEVTKVNKLMGWLLG